MPAMINQEYATPAIVAPKRPAQFLDVDFQYTAAESALQKILARPPGDPFGYVVTPNVDHLVRLHQRRSDLWPIYRNAWLTLCDSRILSRLARRASFDLPVVTGSDLTARLIRHDMPRDATIAVVGGEAAMIEQLRDRYGLTNLVHYNPPFRFIEDRRQVARAVDFLISAQARFAFLAVGSPQQELLAYRVRRTGRAIGVGLCVGASLRFMTGAEQRAPQVMQDMSMEWMFRLVTNPKRLWRRYLVDGPEIFLVYRHWRSRSRDPLAVV